MDLKKNKLENKWSIIIISILVILSSIFYSLYGDINKRVEGFTKKTVGVMSSIADYNLAQYNQAIYVYQSQTSSKDEKIEAKIFISELNNIKNIEYYSVDNINGNTKLSNAKHNLKPLTDEHGDKEKIKQLQDLYRAYVVIKYDDSGHYKVFQKYGYNLAEENNPIEEILDKASENISLNYKIRNTTYVYAIPKKLDIGGRIYYFITDFQAGRYMQISKEYILLFGGITAFLAMLIPYKKSKYLIGFKYLTKVPLEIILVLGYVFIKVQTSLSGKVIQKSINQSIFYSIDRILKLNEGTTVAYLNNYLLSISTFLINIVYWSICLYIIFCLTLVIKHIINYGIKKYAEKYSLAYKFIKRGSKIDFNNETLIRLIIFILLNTCILLYLVLRIVKSGDIGYRRGVIMYMIILCIYTIIIILIVAKRFITMKKNYEKLSNLVNEISDGNLGSKVEDDLDVFESIKQKIENIQDGFDKAIKEETKSQIMKTELISNVSHDLKTPLASIISYIDFLKDPNISEEQTKEYVDILDKKSQRLKVLIEDLFEVSKANSGNINLNIADVDIASMLKQVIIELQDKVEESNLTLKYDIPDKHVILPIDSNRMYRVFENLIINITKYSMSGSRVYVELIDGEESVKIIFKNITAYEIDFNPNELVERFVRGDKSRNTKGSGLGLAIVKSFLELHKAKFNIVLDGDLFKAIIEFDK